MSVYKSADDGMGIMYEIVEHIATLQLHPTGWRKELNLVSWNGAEPKPDIRDWSPDYAQMGRGLNISTEVMDKLVLGYIKYKLNE